MKQEEKDIIKAQIRKELSSLERSLPTLTELIDGEVQSDANDWFTSKESNPSKEINEQALEKAKQRIITLKDVLLKVDSDTYGICVRCNKPIPFERLKAMPTANRHLKCG